MTDAPEASSGDKERSAIARRAGVVGIGTLASRFLGLLRDQAIAAMFPLATTDAFWIAFTLPNLFRQLLGEGGISSAVVPVLSQVKERKGDAAAAIYFSKIRGLSLLALAVTTALGMIFAPQLVTLFAKGFEQRAGEMERTIVLARWCFPYLLFVGSAALGAAALNVNRNFWVAAFAPGLLNVSFLVAAFLLPTLLRRGGYEIGIALAIGALVGGVLQAVVQLPALSRIGYGARPRLDFADPDVRTTVRRIGPITLGIGIYFIDLVVCRRWLSTMGEGALSYFSWAQRLCDFPQGIFTIAIQTAALPSMALLAERRDHVELGKTFAYGMRLALFVAIPVSLAFVFLADPIIIAVYRRGQFTDQAAHETARALIAQGAGIWSVAAVRQLVPTFYARGETRIPVFVSMLDLIALVIFAVTLQGPLGHVGISWAVSGSSIVQMILLWLMLSRRMPTFSAEISISALRTLAASIAGGATGAWVARQVSEHVTTGAIGRTLPGIVGGAVFGIVFLVIAFALKSDELAVIFGGLARRLRRRR